MAGGSLSEGCPRSCSHKSRSPSHHVPARAAHIPKTRPIRVQGLNFISTQVTMHGWSTHGCLLLFPKLGYGSGGRPCTGSLVGARRSKQPDFPWARLPPSLLTVDFPTQLYFLPEACLHCLQPGL